MLCDTSSPLNVGDEDGEAYDNDGEEELHFYLLSMPKMQVPFLLASLAFQFWHILHYVIP